MRTRLTTAIGLRHPIVQAGMSWASSSAALPIAVSRAGALGVVAAGPLGVEALRTILREVRHAVDGAPFAVNVPLTRSGADDVLDVAYEERVPVVIASQGSPRGRLERFRDRGIPWWHVVASAEHAVKAAAAGADALVVVGGEAGGHPPKSEVTTLVLVRRVLQEVTVPVVAGAAQPTATAWPR